VKLVVWCIGVGKIFCNQKKNGWSHYSMVQPSLFFPYFDLMMQYCILLLISGLRREMGLCEFIFL